MTEQECRKAFIKAAHDVIKVWPGYASYQFPAPTNRTDQCLQCDLRFSQEIFIQVWQDCRAGRATPTEFERELTHWRIQRMHTAEIYDLGKPDIADSVDKRKKERLVARREQCKFRRN